MKAISPRRLSVVAAAAACLVVGTATAASAGTNSPISDASNGDGYAYFVANGDDFFIHDNQCDGGTVWAQLTWYKRGQGWHYRTIHNTSGCNTTDTKHPWSDIPEGADVWVRACGGVSEGWSNSGDGVLSAGHDCDFTQGGQHGIA